MVVAPVPPVVGEPDPPVGVAPVPPVVVTPGAPVVEVPGAPVVVGPGPPGTENCYKLCLHTHYLCTVDNETDNTFWYICPFSILESVLANMLRNLYKALTMFI